MKNSLPSLLAAADGSGDLVAAFGPILILLTLVFVFYIAPLFWVVGFAKREKKDWRIALAAGLLFSWLLALLVVLVVPKLSDEDHERINQPGKPKARSFRLFGSGRARTIEPLEMPGSGELFGPLMWLLGGCSVALGAAVIFISRLG